MPHGFCDIIATDPPYGISHPCNYADRGRGGLAKCTNYEDVAGDSEPYDPSVLLAINKPTILWGGNHFASRLPDAGGWLVWDKLRPDGLDQATCELAWTNCVKGVRRFTHLWNGCMRQSERGENYHPTQKPVALYRWCLTLPWTLTQPVVFDPYMGSGPCPIACVGMSRPCIGVELSTAYFDIAVKRIEQAFADQALFTQAEPVAEQTEIDW